MALSIAFSEPTTVNTSGAFLAGGAVYDTGHSNWVYLGFRSPTNVLSCQTSAAGASGTWTMRTMPVATTWHQVAYTSSLGSAGRLVAVGSASGVGAAAWSDDGGATWSAATSLPETNNWNDVAWWPAQGFFVAVASTGTHRVMTSTDGKSWTNQTAASALAWSGVAVSGTTAVAVAFLSGSTSTQLVMTSTDGAAWTLQTHTALETRRGVVNGSRLSVGYSSDLDMFLITADDGVNGTRAWRSTDSGATWSMSNAIPTIGGATNRGYLWLSAASSWYMSCANFNYVESTDGITWTRTALSVSHGSYMPMGWDNGTHTLLGGSTLGFDTVLLGAVTVSTVTSVSPAMGSTAGGTAVTITGTSFSGSPSVTFGGVAATSVVVVNSTTITCVTGAHAAGLVTVAVGSASLANGYTYVVPPALTSLTPVIGPKAGGTVVTLTGTGFTGATSVTFDGTAASGLIVSSDTTIICVTPAHAGALVDVAVVGVTTSTLPAAFTFLSVLHVSPRTGTVAGGTAVTITGFGFNAATGVLFDTAAATSVVLDPVTPNIKLTAVTPAHASGLVDVTVSGVDSGADLYTYTLPIPQLQGKGPLLPPIPTPRLS